MFKCINIYTCKYKYLFISKIILLIIFTILGCSENDKTTPVEFTKYFDNPVIPEGSEGSQDHWKSDPFVLLENGIYKMWFGYNADGTKTQIGYATSYDGISWTIQQLPALPLGEDGEWDDEDVETPFVVKVNGVYHMYYCARGEPEGSDWSPEATYRIGHATSSNGLNWVKDPDNPILQLGDYNTNEWDGYVVAEPSIVYRENTFEMYYVGGTIEGDIFVLSLGFATSTDGSNWTKYNGNPIISHNEDNVGAPFVLHNGTNYELWYTGTPKEEPYFPEGPFWYYTSTDGINWNRSESFALEKGSIGEWDSSGIFGPTVIIDGDEEKMWYSGYYTDNETFLDFAIGYAIRDYY